MHIEIAPQEVASLIESLYDGVHRRLAWSLTSHPTGWRERLDLKVAQKVTDSMMSAYIKIVMAYREDDTISTDSRFDDAFRFNDAVMDAMDTLTMAKTWDDIPVHSPHSVKGECDLCDAIYGRH